MILSYEEIKEAVQDSYESLHDEFKYTPKNTLYATIGDYNFCEEYTLTDECCIYINFALIFIKKGENIEFMKEQLFELVREMHMEKYEKELGNDFKYFIDDLYKLKNLLGSV